MDPLTLGVFVLSVWIVLVLTGGASRLVPRSYLEDVVAGPGGPTVVTRARARSAVSVLGVLALMIGFSVAIPVLRNPLFLVVGAVVGYFLPGFWLRGSTFGRRALVAGLVLAAIYVALVVMLQRT